MVGVELADIAFSIDSILAAVAMAEGLPDRFNQMHVWILSVKLWVVYIGGVLGIVTMRYVAGLFLILLRRFSGLAIGAYVLVAWIGLELTGSGLYTALHPVAPPGAPAPPAPAWHSHMPDWVFNLPLEMPDWLFWVGMVVIVVLSMLYQPAKLAKRARRMPRGSPKSSRASRTRNLPPAELGRRVSLQDRLIRADARLALQVDRRRLIRRSSRAHRACGRSA